MDNSSATPTEVSRHRGVHQEVQSSELDLVGSLDTDRTAVLLATTRVLAAAAEAARVEMQRVEVH